MRLINADKLLEDLKADEEASKMPLMWHNGIMYAEEHINLAPTVDAIPVRHGKWIYGNDFHWYTASCSACGYQRRTDIKTTGWNQWKYCPNCGAKMDAERKEE